jgi:uncharacterized protein
LSQHLKTFLFTAGPITGIEATMEDNGGSAASSGDGSLGIGSLKSAKAEVSK